MHCVLTIDHYVVSLQVDVDYTYRVKIINKGKKSEFVTRDLKTFTGVFLSIKALKLKIIEEMDSLVPSTLDFQVGYFSGKQSKKNWLIDESDLKDMYDANESRKSIFLWCDSAEEQVKQVKRTKTVSSQIPAAKSRKIEIDEELEERIKAIHGDKYSYSQYRIWARLVQSGMFKDISVVPPIPALQGTPQPFSNKGQDSLKDVIAGAAVTFVNAMRSLHF